MNSHFSDIHFFSHSVRLHPHRSAIASSLCFSLSVFGSVSRLCAPSRSAEKSESKRLCRAVSVSVSVSRNSAPNLSIGCASLFASGIRTAQFELALQNGVNLCFAVQTTFAIASQRSAFPFRSKRTISFVSNFLSVAVVFIFIFVFIFEFAFSFSCSRTPRSDKLALRFPFRFRGRRRIRFGMLSFGGSKMDSMDSALCSLRIDGDRDVDGRVDSIL